MFPIKPHFFQPSSADGAPAAAALLGHRQRRARAALGLWLAAGALAAGRAEVVDAEPGLPEPGADGGVPLSNPEVTIMNHHQ